MILSLKDVSEKHKYLLTRYEYSIKEPVLSGSGDAFFQQMLNNWFNLDDIMLFARRYDGMNTACTAMQSFNGEKIFKDGIKWK